MLCRSFLFRLQLSFVLLSVFSLSALNTAHAAQGLAPVPKLSPLPVLMAQAKIVQPQAKVTSKPLATKMLPVKAMPLKALPMALAPAPVYINAILAKVQFPLSASSLAAQSLAQVPMNDTAAMLRFLNSQPTDLFWHVNAIQQMQSWSGSSKLAFGDLLRERQKLNPASAEAAFDFGFAQMTLNNNREGIVFLRKANEALESQVSALVYAAAIADSERGFEQGNPETISARKLDAVYKLNDAIKRDAKNHHAGFWPAFMQVVNTLKAVPAYETNLTGDFSALYVPLGNRVPNYVAPSLALKELFPASGLSSQRLPIDFVTEKATAASEVALATGDVSFLGEVPVPHFSTEEAKKTNFFSRRSEKRQAKHRNAAALKSNADLLVGQVPKALVERTDYIRFQENAPWIALHFLRPNVSFNPSVSAMPTLGDGASSQVPNVLLVTSQQQIVGSLFSAVKPYIVEDLERDGLFEIVLRQYSETPLNPVQVYRLQSNGAFTADASVSGLFQ
jgi:hypothetical protein